MNRRLATVLLFLPLISFAQKLEISGFGLKVDIATEAGGRIVSLQWNDSKNLLDVDSDALAQIQPPKKNQWMQNFLDPRGHVFWLSPQREWWLHQDLFPEKKRRHSPWPPDPYFEFGRSKILKKTQGSVLLSLAKSPISGIRMEKIYKITQSQSGAELHLTCRIWNESKKDRTLAIWSVTRPTPDSQVFISGSTVPLRHLPDVKTKNGKIHFTATPQTPTFKINIQPSDAKGFIIETDDIKWQKVWSKPQTEPPSGHAYAEIAYTSGKHPLLEIECHGNTANLKQGESLVFHERWIFNNK